jgi:hypothetical protein
MALSMYSFLLGDDLNAGAESADHKLEIDRVSLHLSWQAPEANRVSNVDGEEIFNSR